LLPFCYPTSSISLYRGPDRGVNLGRRVLLHAAQDVAIEVEGDADARMAEPLLRYLRMNAAGEQMRRMRVPQIVEPDVRQTARFGQQPDEFMGQAVRLEWLAVRLRHDMSLVREPNADPQKLLRLPEPGLAQFIHDESREGDSASPAALGFLEPHALRRLLGAFDDGELPPGKIGRGPAKSGDLSAPQSAQGGEQDRDEHARLAEMGEQLRRLCRIERLHLASLDLGRIDGVEGVVVQDAPAHRRRQRLLEDTVHVVDGSRRQSAGAVPAAGLEGFGVGCGDLLGPELRENGLAQ
jgi:hypothetical protein